MRYHFTLYNKKDAWHQALQGSGEIGTLPCDGGDVKLCNRWDNSPAVSQKVKKLPYDPAIALQSV